MTRTTMPTAIAGAREFGLVGPRQLHAVQVIDIGRLTPHVVPFVPGTFVAISGRGPKGDSNESGKTTFLAGSSLLLGDPEWKLAAGGQHAYGLLFDPPSVGALDGIADRAEHGYVIGLFATPGEPPTDPVTVWMRINRQSPYLEVKAQAGEWLIDPDGDRPPQLAADEQWVQMVHMGAGRAVGARNFVEVLYGATPRCIAHLTKRADLSGGRSLLNTAAGAFEPEQIGAALITLAGRQDMLDEDREQRAELDRADRELREKQAAFEVRQRDYERILADVDARDSARKLLAQATHVWETHDARRYVDALNDQLTKQGEYDSELPRRSELDAAVARAQAELEQLADDAELRGRHGEAQTALGEAQQAFDDATKRHFEAERALESTREHERDLQAVAADWVGPDADETATALEQADADAKTAEIGLGVARAELARCRAALEDAREGHGDAKAALDRLAAAGVPALGLLDSVELADDARAQLEPMLWPYRDAVVVEPIELDAALAALADQPWAVIVSGDPPAVLVDGILDCPAAARQLLSELSAHGAVEHDPDRVVDTRGGVTVIGAPEPLTGRRARVAAAERQVELVEVATQEADAASHLAKLLLSSAQDDHRRATAAAALSTATAAVAAVEAEVEDAAKAREGARAGRQKAEAFERELDLKLTGLETTRARAEEDFEAATTAVTEHETTVARLMVDLKALRDSVDSTEATWGHGERAARDRCDADPRDETRLRQVANDTLGDALREIGMRRDHEWAPTDDLLAAWRRRIQDENTPFPALAEPLGDYLVEHAQRDETQRERIEADRMQMADALGAVEIEVKQTRSALGRIQDAIQTSIESAIAGIEEQFNRLDHEAGGHGAQLVLDMRPPVDAMDTWHWAVTPMWRRTPGGKMVPYSAPTNSAQDKLYTVNLVLAALLAVPNPEGRVLILDELGDSLGYEHRRDVLRAIAETARDKGITVLGTCQDDVLHHAADFTQEIIFFHYADDRHVINHPVRLFGFDPNGVRVELTREAVLRGRPVV
jgi:uncharacterized coiled-coil protein SlyX